MVDPKETLTPTPITQDGEITLTSHGHIKMDNKHQIYNKDISPKRPPGFQQRNMAPQSVPKSNLELMLENFIQDQTKSMKEVKESLKEHKEIFQQHDAKFDKIFTHLKLLDNQVASQASSSNFRQSGHFPS